MIIFADLHLSEDSAGTVFQKVLPGLREAALIDRDRTIVCLGDFWHVRYKIPVALQNQVVEWLRSLQRENISLIFLPGNHDQINGSGEHALEVFADFPLVTVHSKPGWDAHGLWIPYRKRPEDFLEALTLPPPPHWQDQHGIMRPLRVLWTHHGIRGAEKARKVFDSDGVDADILFPFRLVICGHYHKRQAVRHTVVYVGSPYQVTAAEAGEVKGYARYSAQTDELLWIDTVWGKRYHEVDLAELNARDVAQAQLRMFSPGDEVRIHGGGTRESQELIQSLVPSGAHCVAEVVTEAPPVRLDVGPTPTLESYARAYAAKTLSCPESVEEAMAFYREIVQP